MSISILKQQWTHSVDSSQAHIFDLSIYFYLEKTTTAVMIKYKDVSYLSCFNSVIQTIQNVFILNLFFFIFL